MGLYDVPDLDTAKRVILTGNTEYRWQTETHLMATLIGDPGAHVFDYGCGVGRIAKELIERWPNVTVVGVDKSEPMRKLAVPYVDSRRFICLAPESITEDHSWADTAVAIWALQHIEEIDLALDRIHTALRLGGRLFVAGVSVRLLPIEGGWRDDGKDVWGLLKKRFKRIGRGPLPEELLASWSMYEKDDR